MLLLGRFQKAIDIVVLTSMSKRRLRMTTSLVSSNGAGTRDAARGLVEGLCGLKCGHILFSRIMVINRPVQRRPHRLPNKKPHRLQDHPSQGCTITQLEDQLHYLSIQKRLLIALKQSIPRDGSSEAGMASSQDIL